MVKGNQKTRFVLNRDMEISGIIYWAAPYSTGFSCIIPKGTVLIPMGPAVEAGGMFVAVPEHEKLAEELFIDENDRKHPKHPQHLKDAW